MADKFVKWSDDGRVLDETIPITSSSGAADAGKIVATGPDGQIDPTFLGAANINDSGREMTAFEALSAGDFVNVFMDGGTPKLRRADAGNKATRAHGFVKESAEGGGTVTFYHCGVNGGLTGLTAGATLFLSDATPGKASATVPVAAGHIAQSVGVALSDTESLVTIGQTPVVRA
jgi:hypothetical protein